MSSGAAIDLPSPPSFRVDERRALVTGAGRGIGAAAAAALAHAGAHVVLVARRGTEVEAMASAICGLGLSAESLELDVTNTTAVRDAVERMGPFDILVNSAGMNRPKPSLDVSEDDFDTVMAVNLRAVYFVAQAVASGLISANRAGSIINISSQMGHVGSANRSIYCASKHAVEGLTKSMAIEFGPRNVRVNTVCPTFIETPMTRPFFEDSKFRHEVLSKIKLGRIGRVEDVTGAIVFLASEASALITGSALMIDGGWTAD